MYIVVISDLIGYFSLNYLKIPLVNCAIECKFGQVSVNIGSIRPISLSSFLLKTIEKLIYTHKGIQKHGGSEDREYTLAAFFSTVGALNNVKTVSIKEWIVTMLEGRIITSDIKNRSTSMLAITGTPQGESYHQRCG